MCRKKNESDLSFTSYIIFTTAFNVPKLTSVHGEVFEEQYRIMFKA